MSNGSYDMTDEELEAEFKAARDNEEADADTETDESDTSSDSYEEGSDSDEGLEENGEEESSPRASSARATKPSAPEYHKFRANGKEYEITEEEMREQFPRIFGQAMDYTKKMQAIKPWRKSIDALEQAKLSHEDINLMIDVFKGDKKAVAELLKQAKVDPLDLTSEEGTYVRNDYGRDHVILDIQEVVEGIRHDKEYATTHQVITKDWDEASWNELSADPDKIRLLHVDVKSGLYAKLQPSAQKLKLFDNGRKSDIDYYLAAAREYYTRLSNAQVQDRGAALSRPEHALEARSRVAKVANESQKRADTKEAAAKRKAAAPTGKAGAKRGPTNYLSITDEGFDEAFEEWYKELENR